MKVATENKAATKLNITKPCAHYDDVIMRTMAPQITSLPFFLLSRFFGLRSKKTSKLRVTGLCAGNSPGTGEFPAQMASNAENVSIWWRHHAYFIGHNEWSNLASWIIDMNNDGNPFPRTILLTLINVPINTFRPRQHGRHFADDIWSAFSWMKMFEFRFKFHWILFPRIQLTIFQHWFR